MRRRPVEPRARGTGEEAFGRRPDEGRNALAHLLPRYLLEQPVAVEAAPEERASAQRHRRRDLAELQAEVIARDEDVGWEMGIAQELRVAREEQPAFAARAVDQRPPGEM